jgi:hypothetical protein
MAPIDNRFADIPMNLKHMKANKRESGIIIETMNVLRQSSIKINTIKVTKRIPSARFFKTVSLQ